MGSQRKRRACIGSIGALLVGMAWVFAPVCGVETIPAKIVVETDPGPSAIIPDETLVQTRVRVVDTGGQPIPGARVALHLDSPPSPKIFTTDFPWVEGTTLLDLAVEAPQGEVQFTTIYPIRGTYTFQTQVTLPDGTSFNTSPTLSISENPAESGNFLLLLIVLFGTGLISGLIIGRRRRAALALFLTGTLLAMSSATMAHSSDPSDTAMQIKPITVTQTNGSLHATLTVTPGKGRVGALNTVEVKLTDTDGSPVAGEATLVVWHAEEKKPIYIFHFPVQNNSARVQMQFFDGAEHEIRLEATTADNSTVILSTPVAVEAPSPPFWLKIRIFLMLLGVVALGLIIGFRLGVRQSRQK